MKRPLQDRLARIVITQEVDVVILAECVEPSGNVLTALNAVTAGAYHLPYSMGSKLHLFTRFEARLTTDLFNDPIGGLTIRHLQIGAHPGILLAGVHFPSRVNWDRDDQTLEATTLANDIARTEAEQFNDRTVLVGDLNMNPFDPGIVGAQALHAVMTKRLASRQERDVRGRPYRFFYNPMWGHFGDRTDGPPATYYLSSSKPGNHFWHMYDQVLLRPALMNSLREVRILDTDGMEPLVSPNGIPNQTGGSDHLPLLFRLEL